MGSGAFRTVKREFSHPFRKEIWWFRGNSVPLQPQKCLKSERREGAIAQLVEQRTENPCVPGSIPGGTTHEAPKCSESVSELLYSTLRLLVLREASKKNGRVPYGAVRTNGWWAVGQPNSEEAHSKS